MGNMQDFYREFLLDHYHNPRNFGSIQEPDITHEEKNPLCGDRIRIDLRVVDGVIQDVRFSGEGCAISVASASILTELVKGKTLEEISHFRREELLEKIGMKVSPARMKCAILSLKTLKIGVFGFDKWQQEEDEYEDF